MAQRPQRPRNQLRRYFALSENNRGFDRDEHIHEGFGIAERNRTTFINTSSLDFHYKVRTTPFFDFEI